MWRINQINQTQANWYLPSDLTQPIKTKFSLLYLTFHIRCLSHWSPTYHQPDSAFKDLIWNVSKYSYICSLSTNKITISKPKCKITFLYLVRSLRTCSNSFALTVLAHTLVNCQSQEQLWRTSRKNIAVRTTNLGFETDTKHFLSGSIKRQNLILYGNCEIWYRQRYLFNSPH